MILNAVTKKDFHSGIYTLPFSRYYGVVVIVARLFLPVGADVLWYHLPRRVTVKFTQSMLGITP